MIKDHQIIEKYGRPAALLKLWLLQRLQLVMRTQDDLPMQIVNEAISRLSDALEEGMVDAKAMRLNDRGEPMGNAADYWALDCCLELMANMKTPPLPEPIIELPTPWSKRLFPTFLKILEKRVL